MLCKDVWPVLVAQWFKQPSGNSEVAGSNPGSRPRGTSASGSWVRDTAHPALEQALSSPARSWPPSLRSLSPRGSFRVPMPMPIRWVAGQERSRAQAEPLWQVRLVARCAFVGGSWMLGQMS